MSTVLVRESVSAAAMCLSNIIPLRLFYFIFLFCCGGFNAMCAGGER